MMANESGCTRSRWLNWCYNIQWKSIIKNNLILILTIGGVIFGFLLGFLVKTIHPSQDAIMWIGILGEVYMRMLKMMILPLIICSVITGTASLDPKSNGKVSLVALVYIIGTNATSCIVGIAVGLIFKPGQGFDIGHSLNTTRQIEVMETQDIFADLIRNLFPDNLVTACFWQAQTKYKVTERIVEVNNGSGQLINQTVRSTTKYLGTANSADILGLVLSSLVFGIACTAVGDAGKPFVAFFQSATEIVMKILRWFVWFTPVGVASLIAVALLGAAQQEGAFRSLGMLSAAVCVGLGVHQLLFVSLLYFLITKANPYTFLLTLSRPVMIAFATASSAISLPEILYSLEHTNKVDRRVSRFVVPFAATINRDGSALYMATACIFIAQISGVPLGGGKVFLICILTTVISVAIPSVPSASVVAVVINLTALNIPADSIGLLFALEWILDRVRSSVNTISHGYCTMITYKMCMKSMMDAPTNISAEQEVLLQEVPDTEDKSSRPPEVAQVSFDNKAKSSDHDSTVIIEEKEIVVQEVPDTEDKSFRPPEVPPEVSQVLLDNKAKSSDHNSDDIGV